MSAPIFRRLFGPKKYIDPAVLALAATYCQDTGHLGSVERLALAMEYAIESELEALNDERAVAARQLELRA